MKIEDLKTSSDFQRFLEDKYTLSSVSYYEDHKEFYNEFELYRDINKLLEMRTRETIDLMKEDRYITAERVNEVLSINPPVDQ